MVLSLYLMVISFCAYTVLPDLGLEEWQNFSVGLGIVFFCIADNCYTKKIKALEKAIEDLKRAK